VDGKTQIRKKIEMNLGLAILIAAAGGFLTWLVIPYVEAWQVKREGEKRRMEGEVNRWLHA